MPQDMNATILVIPFKKALIEKASDWKLVVKTTGMRDIDKIASMVDSKNLYRIAVSAIDSLAAVEFKAEWRNLPLIFLLKTAGGLLDFVHAVDDLRASAARFYFPATVENITAARVLSSLNIKSGLMLNDKTDWGALKDLLEYDAYGRITHRVTEPFGYAYSHCKDPNSNYNELLFEKEGKFIHCDNSGNLAVSANELEKGSFIGHIDGLGDLDIKSIKIAAKKKALSPLLKFKGCSVCSAWQVCGRKNTEYQDKCECKEFMTALFDAAEYVNAYANNHFQAN